MFKHFYESLCNEKYSEMNRNCSNYSLGTNKFLQGCCSNVHAFFAWALELWIISGIRPGVHGQNGMAAAACEVLNLETCTSKWKKLLNEEYKAISKLQIVYIYENFKYVKECA